MNLGSFGIFGDVTVSGTRIVCSICVNDHCQKKRSIKERLFTKPWSPFKKYKTVHSPVAFMLDGMVVVSPETYSKIMKGEIGPPRIST